MSHTLKTQRIHALVQAIARFLERQDRGTAGIGEVLDRLAGFDLSLGATKDLDAIAAPHEDVLSHALNRLTEPGLQEIAKTIRAARQDLVWREDRGLYYPPNSDLGAGYISGNMHSMLIGPGACGYDAEDFCLGLFLLGPRTLYRDHAHDAPELYVTLCPQSGWRFDQGPWRNLEAGSIVWNAPGEVHATRSYDDPFLSIFAWTGDIDGLCQVIPAPDWAEIEAALGS